MRNSQHGDTLLEGDSREFKVRIIERLTYLERKLSNGPATENAMLTEAIVNEMSNFDNDMLETINREFFKRALEKIL